MKHLFLMLILGALTLSAQAQEYGILAGIHNTDIDTPSGPFSVDTEIGWRAGLVGKYEIADGVHFRSGVLYVDRKFSMEESSSTTNLDIKMAYLDIPVLFQFQMNETISFFAGPVIGINVSKKVSGTASGVSGSDDLENVKGLYLLAQAGVNFTFDQIGFDVYYERGFGEIADDSFKDYNIIGANFLYWF
ncbi:MAG: PorT family protein [Bdellovibrionales bacterium]|nr:PorT family protein [Bdellovibrionales bacterium]